MEQVTAQTDTLMPRCQTESTLSVQRAFAVHLGTGGGPARRRFRGRVEHLSSGQATQFASLKDLLAFFAAIIDGAVPTAPRSRVDSDPIHRRACPPPDWP